MIFFSETPILIGVTEMIYLELLKRLQKTKYFLFSQKELHFFFPHTNKKTMQNQLADWVKKGYIVRLRQNLYELADKGATDKVIPDIYIANKLYAPSYISLETALSIYNIIPEVAFGVTSITTKPTRVFKNNYGQFGYFSCQPKAYTGYVIREYAGYKVLMAEPEKAVVDFIYFRLKAAKSSDFAGERMNKNLLAELNWRKLAKYGRLYNKKVRKQLQELKRYIGC